MHRISQLTHPSHRPLWRAATIQHRTALPHLSPAPTFRPFSHSPRISYPRKDSQHKDSINTEATEYSKSGTDDASARHEDTAFDPTVTGPGEQKDKVGSKTGGEQASDNPLEVSPANHDVSQPRSSTEGGAESSSASSGDVSGRERSSGGGSPRKGSRVA
ncbi:MAG: hypothetical protein Q9219_000389 [cf. Caloplaca sp. 3 TL-2023]